jgi:hypothetical protein
VPPGAMWCAHPCGCGRQGSDARWSGCRAAHQTSPKPRPTQHAGWSQVPRLLGHSAVAWGNGL